MSYSKTDFMKMKLIDIKQYAIDNDIIRGTFNKENLIDRIITEMKYKKCTPPQIRSRVTNRCGRKPCSKKQTRDKITKVCRSKKRSGRKRSKSVSNDEDDLVSYEKKRRDVAREAASRAATEAAEKDKAATRIAQVVKMKAAEKKRKESEVTTKTWNGEVVNLKKTETNDKSGPNTSMVMDGWEGEWKGPTGKKNKEIPCDAFKGKSSCENEYSDEYEDFTLRRCKWNQTGKSKFCEVLSGSLDDRLRVTLGLSKEEFSMRRRTIDDKNKEIQNEVKRLRNANKTMSIDLAKKQVVQRKEDELKVTHESAKKIQKQIEKLANEIRKDKDINKEVKDEMNHVTSDLVVLAETETQLTNAKAAQNKGIGNLIDFEALIKKKQDAGAKTDEELKKLGNEFNHMAKNEEKIETLELKMDESRKNLMASIQNAKKSVVKSDSSTKDALATIGMSTALLAGVTEKSQSCQLGKIWDSVKKECLCRDGEIENEDGECMNKKFVELSTWHQAKDDGDDEDSDFEDE